MAAAVGAALLLLVSSLTAAPTLSVDASAAAGIVSTRLTLRWDQPEELVASLVGGLESRIVFTARLYQPRTGLFAFRGDRLIAETSVVRRAYRDILTQLFVIDEGAGVLRRFLTIDDLLQAFLSVAGLTFPARAGSGAYVAARVQLEPVRLMPPLTLVSLAGTGAYATPWTRSAPP